MVSVTRPRSPASSFSMIYAFCVFCVSFLIFCADFSLIISEDVPIGHLKPLGSHRPPEGSVATLDVVPSPIEFYDQFVVQSKPVIFKGAGKTSRGFYQWSDEYLRQNYGDTIVRVDYGKKENRARSADNIPLKEFLAVYNTSDRYLVDTLPKPLWGDFSLIECLLCGGFTDGLQDAVLWFSSGGTKSFLHVDTVENINCLMSGQKDWFFVDLEHSKQIDMDHGEGDYCSVDVDKVDMNKYPSLRHIPWWSAHINTGDCMYIPYGWAHQVRSHSRNIAVNIWWTPLHSFNATDCKGKADLSSTDKVSLNNFEFTIGEQLRFQALQVVNQRGGSITFHQIHELIVSEHTGEKLITKERFRLLDANRDDILTVEEITSPPPELIEEAFGGIHPGEVNIRGLSIRRDERLVELLDSVPRQPPEVEEFLLREHKSSEELKAFRAKHWQDLPQVLRTYIQEKHFSEDRHEHAEL